MGDIEIEVGEDADKNNNNNNPVSPRPLSPAQGDPIICSDPPHSDLGKSSNCATCDE